MSDVRILDRCSADDLLTEAHEVIDEAVGLHAPSRTFALFSGGHDSLCATHVASRHARFDGVAHINTGIGIEETREFIRDTCRRYGWPLREYRSPVSFESLVRRWGFPGGPGHSLVYNRLKERCLRQMVREHKAGRHDRIALVTGSRRSESKRRMAWAEPVQRDGCRVWVAPIVHWDDRDKDAYMQAHDLPRNPVVARLCLSGECLCGAYASAGELVEIRAFYPAAAAEIDRLADIARACGVHDRWGERPPCSRKVDPRQPSLPLCWSCQAKGEE